MVIGIPIPHRVLLGATTSPHTVQAIRDVADKIGRTATSHGADFDLGRPDGTGPTTLPLAPIDEDEILTAREISREFTRIASFADSAAPNARSSWSFQILSELFAALAVDDESTLRTALITVAADITRWAAAIDQRLTDAINDDRADRGTDR